MILRCIAVTDIMRKILPTVQKPARYTGGEYNEIQKQQGLDLSKYRRKNATRYTMEITNYGEYNGKVYPVGYTIDNMTADIFAEFIVFLTVYFQYSTRAFPQAS